MESLTQKETNSSVSDNSTARRIVGVIFLVVEIILGFRLVFKLLGANSESGFVKTIYNITQFFVELFEGIFAQTATGDQTVFEPATLIAIIIVALAAWLILKLMTPRQHSVQRTESISGYTTPTTQTPQYPPLQQPLNTQPPQRPADNNNENNRQL